MVWSWSRRPYESQPAREFVVKIIELSLWSSNLFLGHFLLFMPTPPILIPFADRLHATNEFFLYGVEVIGADFNGCAFFSSPCGNAV